MKKTLFILLGAVLFFGCHSKNTIQSGNAPDASLENTHWKLVSLTGLTGNLPVLQKPPYLELKDSKINGFGGCNNFFGGYSLTGNAIRFTAMGMTKMYCAENVDVENTLMQALTSTDHYTISGNRLDLKMNTEVLARFEAGKKP